MEIQALNTQDGVKNYFFSLTIQKEKFHHKMRIDTYTREAEKQHEKHFLGLTARLLNSVKIVQRTWTCRTIGT